MHITLVPQPGAKTSCSVTQRKARPFKNQDPEYGEKLQVEARGYMLPCSTRPWHAWAAVYCLLWPGVTAVCSYAGTTQARSMGPPSGYCEHCCARAAAHNAANCTQHPHKIPKGQTRQLTRENSNSILQNHSHIYPSEALLLQRVAHMGQRIDPQSDTIDAVVHANRRPFHTSCCHKGEEASTLAGHDWRPL